MKKGFTLIELVVVIGLFGLLMVAGTEFLIQVMQNGNRAQIQSEVRQNASMIMQDITGELRKGSSPTYLVTNGVLTKNGVIISSNKVAVSNLSITLVNGTYNISLTVTQSANMTRSDFQATITLTDSVTPRQY